MRWVASLKYVLFWQLVNPLVMPKTEEKGQISSFEQKKNSDTLSDLNFIYVERAIYRRCVHTNCNLEFILAHNSTDHMSATLKCTACPGTFANTKCMSRLAIDYLVDMMQHTNSSKLYGCVANSQFSIKKNIKGVVKNTAFSTSRLGLRARVKN
ncbi:hypothetical protein AYI69_g2570 [Smittium culicis]|uniref:C2H2-type domain-containing protein n=1 Tax=Smittium culicis TaxID=133412 RepID=A0A1R1YM94_9FUNG|nr:hypothetical protein AYI69_g2570 [Smittium culicis]